MHFSAGTITIGDVDYPIAVDENGDWITETMTDGTFLRADTRKALRDKLVVANRKSKVELDIPFAQEKGGRLLQGRITGVHLSNGSYLVLWSDGSRGQVRKHEAFLAGPISSPEVAEYKDLVKAKVDADQALYLWRKGHRIDVGELVEQATAEAES